MLRTTERAPLDLGSGLAMLFLFGGLLMLAGIGLGSIVLAFQLWRSRAAPPWLRVLGQRLLRETGESMRLDIRVHAGPTRPFCFGLRRGTIVVPARICEPERRIQLRQVLRHEIAHLCQRDTRGQLLFAVALPLLFFHPLYWWLRHRCRLSAELIADDRAARHGDRVRYARELITLSQQGLSGPAGLLPAMPAFTSKNQFYRRMKMLLQREDDLATRCSPVHRRLQLCFAGLLIAAGASLWGVEPLAAQESTPRTTHKLQRELLRRQEKIERLQIQIENLQRKLERVMAEVRASNDPREEIVGVEEVAPEIEVEEIEEIEEVEVKEPEEVETIELLGKRALPVPIRAAEVTSTAPLPPTIHVQESAAILDLLTRHIDLSAQRRQAQARLMELEPLNEKGLASDSELENARIAVESTSQKLEILRRLMEAEAQATTVELRSLRQRHAAAKERGDAAGELGANMLRLEARLQMLHSVH